MEDTKKRARFHVGDNGMIGLVNRAHQLRTLIHHAHSNRAHQTVASDSFKIATGRIINHGVQRCVPSSSGSPLPPCGAGGREGGDVVSTPWRCNGVEKICIVTGVSSWASVPAVPSEENFCSSIRFAISPGSVNDTKMVMAANRTNEKLGIT